MIEVFKKYISEKITLAEEEYSIIESVCISRKVKKRQFIMHEGEVCKQIAFVCKGFLRTYFIDDNGDEHIMNFAPENYWSGDRESLMSGFPSKYNIDALEDSDIIVIKKADFDEICKRIPSFNDMTNAILQKSLVVAQQRIHASITYSAEEKYNYFLSKYPSLVNRVPQHMIASYLGLSRETLSRVRKNRLG
ncbi:MAG TPA: Crp/Fnr family transcriptional regulator [Puia sp.]|nr:Crp/Fnr family transcriptional regulator [Puia sp.]